MQKIVIDTNIIVSALIQRGYSNLIINELFIENKFQLCISTELITEYYEVLARPKFLKFQDFLMRVEGLLATIESKAIKFTPDIKLN
jgi:uncharacterized protein